MKHRTFFWRLGPSCPALLSLTASLTLAIGFADTGVTTGAAAEAKGDTKSSPGTSPAKNAMEAAGANVAPADAGPDSSACLLAAARAGSRAEIRVAINDSYQGGARFGAEAAGELLNTLLRQREVEPFRLLLDELRQTNLGKNWQPGAATLTALVAEHRTDFLDILLASRLAPSALLAQKSAVAPGDTTMVAWITRRATETTRDRTDIDRLVDYCKAGDARHVIELLDAGVDVNGRVEDGGWTPLTRAASSGRLDIVRILLDYGALPDLPKYPGWDYTPLCLTSSVQIAHELQRAGANVHTCLYRRNTSILTYVTMWGGAPMVRWFLDQGLDPKMLGDNDETLLFDVKDEATAEILLQAGVDPNRVDKFDRVALMNTRTAGVARALLRHGARLDGFKYPLLPSMIQMSEAGAVEAVLQAGVPHDPVTMQSALISAAHMDQDKTAEVLIRYGANPNAPGEWSGPDYTQLPLLTCAIFGSTKTAKVLLDHGADPNGSQKPGLILRTAISNRHKDLAQLLHDAGATGVSDLAYAIAIGDKALKTQLLTQAPSYTQHPEFWTEVIPAAAKRGDLDVIRVALEKNVPVAADENHSQDAYSDAAFEGQWETLTYLLTHRPPTANPQELRQALWSAVWNSHPYPNQRPAADFETCVQLLLAAGAPVTPPPLDTEGNSHQYNLLIAAVFTRFPGGNRRVIEMLVTAGADPDPQYPDGRRLSDVVNQACTSKTCSTPDQGIVQTLARLRQVKREFTKVGPQP